MTRTQTLVQLNETLLAKLDERAARVDRSRSSLVRDAIERYLDDEIEADIDRSIVEGYERLPQDEAEDAWARHAAVEAIREESW